MSRIVQHLNATTVLAFSALILSITGGAVAFGGQAGSPPKAASTSALGGRWLWSLPRPRARQRARRRARSVLGGLLGQPAQPGQPVKMAPTERQVRRAKKVRQARMVQVAQVEQTGKARQCPRRRAANAVAKAASRSRTRVAVPQPATAKPATPKRCRPTRRRLACGASTHGAKMKDMLCLFLSLSRFR